MVPRKQTPNGIVAVPVEVEPVKAVEVPQPLVRTSKIPSSLRFPLIVLVNLSLSALFYSFTSEFTAGDLASVSRSIDGPWEVTGLVACKALELAVGWAGDYDGLDLASLTYLAHMPTLYLLTAFYGIRPTTGLVSLTIDVLTTYIPFRLLRPVSPTHNPDAPKGAISNKSIINDLPVQGYTTLFATTIYAVILYGSFASWLPVHLVLFFDGLKDISAAHNAQLPFLVLSLLPTGVAAKIFLFTPATGAKPNLREIRETAFNPATATLGQTVKYNVWGHSKRTRTLIKRTATLAAVCFASTLLQLSVTIEGAEIIGAAGWAGIWAVGAVVTGAAFWWVGDVDGVVN